MKNSTNTKLSVKLLNNINICEEKSTLDLLDLN